MQVPVYEWEYKSNPLTEKGFFKTDFNFRESPDSEVRTCPLYGYESAKNLYDIVVIDGHKYYRTNMGPWQVTIDKITPYHYEIERHFGLDSLKNPLTEDESENVLDEAKVHRKIKGDYYQGVAEGMEDIVKEYGRVKGTDVGLRGRRLKSHLAMLNPAGNIKPGDKVGYSQAFLRSTGQYTGPVPFARGVVRSVTAGGIATVDWGDPDIPKKVHVFNLAVIGTAKWRGNPPARKIYNRVIQIFASKEGMPHQCDDKCKRAHHRYQHKFSSKACIYGLSDGSILIK